MQISEAKNEGVKAVGLLLTEICKISAQAAELIEQDLENKSMSIQKCYDALYAHAKKHQTKGCWACPVVGIDPENEAVKVILEFYHIPAEWITTPGYTESQALGRAFARDPSPAAQDDRGIAARAGRIDSFDLLDLL